MTFNIIQASAECLRVDTLKGSYINIQLQYITLMNIANITHELFDLNAYMYWIWISVVINIG